MAIGNYSLETQHEAPKVAATTAPEEPIDRLGPGTELHTKVIEYLLDRLKYSEGVMSGFYGRWNVNEKRLQAYISLPDYELQLKQMTEQGAPPAATAITVPYSYATIWTIVTYLIHTFCGRKPIFDVSAYNEQYMQNAPYMETMLQFNSDHTRLILRLIQWFLDAESYGVGAIRCLWDEEKAKRSFWSQSSPGGAVMPNMQKMLLKQSIYKTIYQGNKVTNIDPYLFFPDPRVPMAEVNKRGEFVFWRSFESKMTLKKAEAIGQLKWVDRLAEKSAGVKDTGTQVGSSMRSLLAKGTAMPGDSRVRDDTRSAPFYQIDQGTVTIIPSELGLADRDEPEKWLFSIGNKMQIIQAEPLDYDHDRHPIAVIEPSSLGYAFGQPGTLDFLGPIQEILSWFVNSHVYNVRTALNNMFIVDPSMVEMQDLKKPGPGKIIRLKRSAYGQDVRSIVQQLQVQDVTANHMQSMEMFLRMGDILAAVNDNLKGIQEAGGRKTATEVRTSNEAGASRLAARARYISAQGMVDLAEQMAVNIQQFQEMEYYLQVVGPKGLAHPLTIGPDKLSGDFYFPVNDGTLPIDKTAMLGIWKEIWMAVIQDPNLSATYDAGKLFEYIAELGGAKNISQFKLSVAPDDQVAGAIEAGNGVPTAGLRGARGASPEVRRPVNNGGVPRGNASVAA